MAKAEPLRMRNVPPGNPAELARLLREDDPELADRVELREENRRLQEALDRIAAEHDNDLMAPTRAVVQLVAERRRLAGILEAAYELSRQEDWRRDAMVAILASSATATPSTEGELTDA